METTKKYYEVERVKYKRNQNEYGSAPIECGFGDEAEKFDTLEEAQDYFKFQATYISKDYWCGSQMRYGYCLLEVIDYIDEDGDCYDTDVTTLDEFSYYHFINCIGDLYDASEYKEYCVCIENGDRYDNIWKHFYTEEDAKEWIEENKDIYDTETFFIEFKNPCYYR